MLNWKNQDAIAWLFKEFPDISLQVWMSPLSPLHFIPGNQNKNYLPGGRSAPKHGTLCALEISRASKEAKESKGWRRVEIIFPAFSLLSFLLGDVFFGINRKTYAQGGRSQCLLPARILFFLLRRTGSCLGKYHPCDAVLGSNIFPPFTRTPGCVGNSWGPLDDHFLWDSKMSALHSENKLGYYNECKEYQLEQDVGGQGWLLVSALHGSLLGHSRPFSGVNHLTLHGLFKGSFAFYLLGKSYTYVYCIKYTCILVYTFYVILYIPHPREDMCFTSVDSLTLNPSNSI